MGDTSNVRSETEDIALWSQPNLGTPFRKRRKNLANLLRRMVLLWRQLVEHVFHRHTAALEKSFTVHKSHVAVLPFLFPFLRGEEIKWGG